VFVCIDACHVDSPGLIGAVFVYLLGRLNAGARRGVPAGGETNGRSDSQNDSAETRRPLRREGDDQGGNRERDGNRFADRGDSIASAEELRDAAPEVKGKDEDETEEGEEGKETELKVLAAAKETIPRPVMLGERG
jgi:hypothetical protein